MAKRRNPKKEKALRNQAYARKFRKRTTNGRYNRRSQQTTQNTEEEEGAADSTSTSATDAEQFAESIASFKGV